MTDSTSGYVHVIYKCRRCEGNHPIEQCPQVKSVTFDPDGRIIRVEYFPPNDLLPPPIVTGDKDFHWRPPYDITVTTTYTQPYDMNKARAWYEATKTYTY